MIGCGSIGKRHIKNIAEYCKQNNHTLELDLLRSSKSDISEEIKTFVNNQFYSMEDLPEKYDYIFITNPTSLHYKTLEETFSLSDNFFIEKPVFDKINLEISQFQNKGKNFYVACPLRYTKVLLEAKKFVEQNKVFSVRAISSSYLPNWRPNVDYRTTYSAHKELGGGVLIDLIHEWDYLSYFFGIPKKVYKMFGKYSDLEINSEDLAIYIAEYNDKLLELHLDYCGKQTKRYCEFITTEGSFCFDIANSKILKNGSTINEFKEDRNDMYYREIENFFSICNGKVININTLEHALEVMKIALD